MMADMKIQQSMSKSWGWNDLICSSVRLDLELY